MLRILIGELHMVRFCTLTLYSHIQNTIVTVPTDSNKTLAFLQHDMLVVFVSLNKQ